jgi:hypothetical protein
MVDALLESLQGTFSRVLTVFEYTKAGILQKWLFLLNDRQPIRKRKKVIVEQKSQCPCR